MPPPAAVPQGPRAGSEAPELGAYRATLIASVLAALLVPLALLPSWYAADLGPEFTAEGVRGWDVGASTQAVLGLALGALIALAISAGAVPASDVERLSAVFAAAALAGAAGVVWYRVAVVPEPASLFVREPGLWLAAVITSVAAALAIASATLAQATEVERLRSRQVAAP